MTPIRTKQGSIGTYSKGKFEILVPKHRTSLGDIKYRTKLRSDRRNVKSHLDKLSTDIEEFKYDF